MRLIDAEVLKESIYKEKEIIQYTQPFIQASLILLEKFIKNAPTIEAKPVVHAHWEEQNDGTHFCSRCGNDATYTYEGKEFVGFLCPFCGAQMDEKFVTDTNVGSKKE